MPAWFVGNGLRVDYARIGVHAAQEGGAGLSCIGPFGVEAGFGEMVSRIAGWVGDPDLPASAVWPEPWPVRENCPEGIGILVRHMQLTKEQYEGICEFAVDLCENPVFKEAVQLVARGLMAAPSIDHEGLEVLREATGIPELA